MKSQMIELLDENIGDIYIHGIMVEKDFLGKTQPVLTEKEKIGTLGYIKILNLFFSKWYWQVPVREKRSD